jgi:hypothetical protein
MYFPASVPPFHFVPVVIGRSRDGKVRKVIFQCTY